MEVIKSRWEAWENICVKKSFEEKIQLKIIAMALGRTIYAVSKRIKKLELRKPTSLCGRIKGKKNQAPWVEKTLHDFTKMTEILHTYAPIKVAQKGQWALKEGYWISAPLVKDLRQGPCIGVVREENPSFAFSYPLEYILSKDPPFQRSRCEKVFINPFYVSLCHVEEWAISKGFYQVKESLRQHGFSYWKDGKHFSKAQLLIYINRIRLEKKLQPLAIYEDDNN